MVPDFLELDDVLRIHQDQIDRHGGEPSIRDIGLLLSAIAQPKATFGGEFLHTDLPEMAAAYLYHIVCNHPFVDGNKRTGTASALVFLEVNGVEIRADNDELAELVLQTAMGKTRKPAIAEFFRRNTA